MDAGRRSSTRSDRDDRKRRREDPQVEEIIDDKIDDASLTKKQRKPDEDLPVVVESEKKKKITIKSKTPIPHKARALNDTLKDLQNSFGISVPSTSTSKARSTLNTFKSSFKYDTQADTPSRIATHSILDTATPSKQVHPASKKNGASLPRPPDSHKKLLDTASTTRHATPSALDKGKGRFVDPEGPSSEDAELAIPADEETSDLPAPNTKTKHQQGVTSLLHLSAKKQFKLPSTPSKPPPLSGRHLPSGLRQETPSGDIKPLKSLGVISGLNSLSSNNTTPATSRKILETRTSEEEGGRREEEQLIKPKWAQLLDSTEIKKRKETTMTQDIIELLSPRKKRKGWVPTGFAENTSGIIKRLQTGNNLWIHEISRLLSSSKSSSSSKFSSSSSNGIGVKRENGEGKELDGKKKTYESLLRDLNPHLRLEILEILSPKAASLTWSSQEGGFITAGAAEKLLITRCRILKDEDPSLNHSTSQAPLSTGETAVLEEESQELFTPFSSATKEWESQIEGMVIFSLTAHSRTSTGITMVRKEQSRPDRQQNLDGSNETGYQNQDKLQPQLNFNQNLNDKKYNVYLPASIADLHTQMRVGDEVWAWEPWSVVDLVDFPINGTLESSNLATTEIQEVDKDSEKTLLVSRFAVLL